jgi:ABC-2 type transport system permease protein
MNILHIAGRELRYIFNTTIGWLVLAGFLVISGIFWAPMVSFYVAQAQDMLANPYAAAQMSLTDHLLVPWGQNLAVVLLLASPALSMRLFSEEIKQKTIELLFTSPVSTLEMVLGKYLGALGFVAIMLACTAYVPISLLLAGNPDGGTILGGYLALFLTAAAMIAMGMLASAMTANQIVAVVMSFCGGLAFWVVSWFSQDQDSFWVQAAMSTHLADMQVGALRAVDLAYFGGFIGFFLFATHQRVDSYRWR